MKLGKITYTLRLNKYSSLVKARNDVFKLNNTQFSTKSSLNASVESISEPSISLNDEKTKGLRHWSEIPGPKVWPILGNIPDIVGSKGKL